MRDTAAETPAPDAPALDPREELYCIHRAQGDTIVDAAKAAGICEATAHVWNKRPEVLARIDALQAPVTAEVMRKFRGKATRAAERVVECMEPGRGGATGELNLKAALAVLKFVGADSLVPTERRQLTGADNGPVVVEDSLSDDERAARIGRLLDAARARRAGSAADGAGPDLR